MIEVEESKNDAKNVRNFVRCSKDRTKRLLKKASTPSVLAAGWKFPAYQAEGIEVFSG